MHHHIEFCAPVWLDTLPTFQRFALPFPDPESAREAAVLLPKAALGWWRVVDDEGGVSARGPALALWQKGCDENEHSAPRLEARRSRIAAMTAAAGFSFGDYKVNFYLEGVYGVLELRYAIGAAPERKEALAWSTAVSKSGAKLSSNFERYFGMACAAWSALPVKERQPPYHAQLIDQVIDAALPACEAIARYNGIKVANRPSLGDEFFHSICSHVASGSRYGGRPNRNHREALAMLATRTPAAEPDETIRVFINSSPRVDKAAAFAVFRDAGIDDLAAAATYHRHAIATMEAEAVRRQQGVFDPGAGPVCRQPVKVEGLPDGAAAGRVFELAGIARYLLFYNASPPMAGPDTVSPALAAAFAAESATPGSVGSAYVGIRQLLDSFRADTYEGHGARVTFFGGGLYWRGRFHLELPLAQITYSGLNMAVSLEDLLDQDDGSRGFRTAAHNRLGKLSRNDSWRIFRDLCARYRALRDGFELLAAGDCKDADTVRIARLVAEHAGQTPELAADGHGCGCDGSRSVLEFVFKRLFPGWATSREWRRLRVYRCDCAFVKGELGIGAGTCGK